MYQAQGKASPAGVCSTVYTKVYQLYKSPLFAKENDLMQPDFGCVAQLQYQANRSKLNQ